MFITFILVGNSRTSRTPQQFLSDTCVFWYFVSYSIPRLSFIKTPSFSFYSSSPNYSWTTGSSTIYRPLLLLVPIFLGDDNGLSLFLPVYSLKSSSVSALSTSFFISFSTSYFDSVLNSSTLSFFYICSVVCKEHFIFTCTFWPHSNYAGCLPSTMMYNRLPSGGSMEFFETIFCYYRK